MKAGDLIFVRGHSPISSLIQQLDGEFSHCAIAVSSTHILESQRFVDTRIAPLYFDDYEVVDLGLTDQQRDVIVHIAIQMVGHPYDYLQVLGIALEKIFKFNNKDFLNSPNRYICSEVVDIILFCANVLLYDEYVGDKTPNELFSYIMEYLQCLTSTK